MSSHSRSGCIQVVYSKQARIDNTESSYILPKLEQERNTVQGIDTLVRTYILVHRFSSRQKKSKEQGAGLGRFEKRMVRCGFDTKFVGASAIMELHTCGFFFVFFVQNLEASPLATSL